MRKLMCLWLMVSLFFKVFAQTKVFTPDDGLSQSSVYSMLQDRNGLLWISTANGIDRFDGTGFTHVITERGKGLKQSAPIGRMNLSPQNTVWIGGIPGIFEIDPVSMKANLRVYGEKQVPLNSVPVYSDDRNAYYSIVPEQVLRVDMKTGQSQKLSIRDFHFHNPMIQGWVPSGDMILCLLPEQTIVFDKNLTRVLTKFDHTNNDIAGIFKLGEMKFLLCFQHSPPELFNFNTKKYEYPFGKNPSHLHSVTGVTRSGHQFIFSNNRSEFYISDYINGRFTSPRHIYEEIRSVFGNYRISSLCRTSDGELWVGVDGLGIVKLYDFSLGIKRYTSQNFGNTTEKLFSKCFYEKSDGSIYMGTFAHGIVVFNSEGDYKRAINSVNSRLPGGVVNAIRSDSRGRIWLSIGPHIYLNEDGNFINFKLTQIGPPGNSENSVYDICELNSGEMIAVSRSGTFLYNSANNAWNILANSNSSSLCVYEDPFGFIWLSNYWGSLDIYRKSDLLNGRQPLKSMFGSMNTRQVIYDSARQVYLVANEKGLHIIDRKFNLTGTYNLENGLPDEFIYGICIDKSGRYWISSNSGIFCLTMPEGNLSFFTPGDGLQSNEFNTGAYLFSSKGLMCFGGINGANFFIPDHLLQKRKRVGLHLVYANAFALSGEKTTLTQKAIQINPKQNNIEAYILLPDFVKTGGVRYEYKIHRSDKNFISLGTRNKILLSGLAAGDYQLIVRARDHFGRYSTEQMLVQFRIKPYFYKSGWFIILVLIFSSLTVYGITRYLYLQRVHLAQAEARRLREVQSLRSALSRELHDNLGSSLSRVSLLTQKLKSTGSVQGEQLEKIERITNDMNRQVRDIVWSIDGTFDDLSSLLAYIRHYAQSVAEEHGLDIHITFSEKVPDLNLSPDVRQSLYAIVKEAINNTLKYSGSTQMSISFLIDDAGRFTLQIADFGKGFDPTKAGTYSCGLKNIKSRCDEHGFVWRLNTAPDKGTEWQISGKFEIPLK